MGFIQITLVKLNSNTSLTFASLLPLQISGNGEIGNESQYIERVFCNTISNAKELLIGAYPNNVDHIH